MAIKTPIISEEKALKQPARKADSGDVIAGDTPTEARANTVNRRLRAKLNNKAAELKNIIEQPGNKKANIEATWLIFLQRKRNCY